MVKTNEMKHFFTILFLGISFTFLGQKIDYNTKKGYIAEGYDVVAYFENNKPIEGKKEFQTTFDGVKFKFSSSKHLKMFKENPKKYIPQYGGYCAYAVAEKNIKINIDPEEFQVKDGKLYLFYSSFFGSKLTNWKEENPSKLKVKADKNWKSLKHKKN